MIISSRHAAWLHDRSAQRRSDARARSLAMEWSASPSFQELRRDVEQAQDRSPAALIAAARRFFDRTGDLDLFLSSLVEGTRADPFLQPPLHPLASEVHQGLLLFDHPDLAIAIGVTGVDQLAAKKAHRTGPASIAFTGMWNCFRYLKAGNARLAFWEAPEIDAEFRSSASQCCRCTGRRIMKDGDELVVDGSRQSFIVEHATGDILYLQAMVRRAAAPLAVEYDSDSCTLIGVTSTDETSSRIQMMATLLRHFDRDDAIPLLREQLTNPHFYTRWHVMRELLALDADAAEPDLRRMAAADPHPEVRAAARQTLDQFFPASAAQVREEELLCPA